MTTLIKNIILVDGTSKPSFKADVLIRDQKIIALGSFPNTKADKIIFGNENYLVPGFIDISSNADRYLSLFSSPLHKDFISQGVTTTIVGHCGFSLAPLFYASLDHFVNWTKTNHININWKTTKEYLDALEKSFNFGVNIGTFSGHKVMREEILKNPKDFRNLTSNELRVLRSVLEGSIRDGSFGLSTGLGYYPYQQITYHELRALLDVVRQNKGIYETHIRNEKESIEEEVKEVLRLSQEMTTTTIISHLRPFFGFEEKYKNAISLIEEKTAKANVYFNINPFSYSAVSIDSFLPDEFRKDDRLALIEKLKDKDISKKVLDVLPKINGEKTIILNAPGVEIINGKNLFDFAQNRGLTVPKAIIELMIISKLRAILFYENLNQQEVDKAIISSRSLISSSGTNVDDHNAFKPDRSNKSFTTFLKKASVENINLEKAIFKISGLPASLLGLESRGFISSGYFADLVLLNKDLDVSMVMVNGNILIEDGQLVPNPILKGAILRKKKK